MEDLIERIKRNEKIKEKKILSKGISQGKSIGKKESKKEGILETIRNTLKLNMAEDIIRQVTGVTIEEIEEMKLKLNKRKANSK